VITGALAIAALSKDPGQRGGRPQTARRLRKVTGWVGPVRDGVRGAIGLLRERDIALLGALGWWALDIAVLGACFHAFGAAPPPAVVAMAYFTGMLGNVLPLPGGLGGVEGGMIGAFLAFGVDGGLAVAAVLSYRAFAYWLPIIPGAVAYLRLLRTVADWPSPARPGT
jgi:putative heme transporter